MYIFLKVLVIFECVCLCTFDNCTKHNVDIIDKNPIGTGCSAKVYKCVYNGSECAVKIIFDENRRNRELKMLEHIRKLNLSITPKIHLIGEDFVVMDLVHGVRLDIFLTEHKNNRELIGKVLQNIFEAMFEHHRNNIVYCDAHNANVFVMDDLSVQIIDFGESWIGDDFIIDFQRLRHRVLDRINDWEKLIVFNEAISLIKQFYDSENFQLVFGLTRNIAAPRLEHSIIQLSRFVFFRMNYQLNQLNQQYTQAISLTAAKR